MPFSHESGFAVAWAQWRPGGTTGEEPPAPARRQIELYETLRGTIDREKQAALMREILAIAAEEFWVIGLALPTAVEVGVTRTTMRNTPATMQGSWAYPDPAPLNPQQFFFAQG
jgi:peptide/nickel transport system substrate-binding protein